MEDVKTLDSIGRECATDKASSYELDGKTHRGHGYLDYYEEFLSKFKNERFTLVELGCASGASIKMWRKYFPFAKIIGVDLSEVPKDVSEINDFTFVRSNVTSEELPEILLSRAHYGICCIIDDCSHAWGDMRLSFEKLFPILQKGGYYIVEDLEGTATGVFDGYMPKVLDSQPFFEYALDRMNILRASKMSNPQTERPLFDKLPKYIQEIELSIDMVMVLPGAIVFRKK